MDDESVTLAVDEVGRILRADGAHLLLIEANPKTARVHLRLVLDTVGCEECILPPAMLRMHNATARPIVIDPRPAAPPMHPAR